MLLSLNGDGFIGLTMHESLTTLMRARAAQGVGCEGCGPGYLEARAGVHNGHIWCRRISGHEGFQQFPIYIFFMQGRALRVACPPGRALLLHKQNVLQDIAYPV